MREAVTLSKRLPPSPTMQEQTGKCCYGATEHNAFMCDTIVHVYRYTVLLVVVHSDISTTKVVSTLYTEDEDLTTFRKSPVSVFLQLCVFLEINPRVIK